MLIEVVEEEVAEIDVEEPRLMELDAVDFAVVLMMLFDAGVAAGWVLPLLEDWSPLGEGLLVPAGTMVADASMSAEWMRVRRFGPESPMFEARVLSDEDDAELCRMGPYICIWL